MTRTTHRIFMGIVVMPFIILGWLFSAWLSEQALQAAERDHPPTIESQETAGLPRY